MRFAHVDLIFRSIKRDRKDIKISGLHIGLVDGILLGNVISIISRLPKDDGIEVLARCPFETECENWCLCCLVIPSCIYSINTILLSYRG